MFLKQLSDQTQAFRIYLQTENSGAVAVSGTLDSYNRASHSDDNQVKAFSG